MNKKMYYIPEAIGTICWLVMDFCWLSKSYDVALLFMLFAVVSLGIAASNALFGEELKISERLNFVASWTWCIMNSFWFISDIPFEKPSLDAVELSLNLAKISFVISSGLVLFSIIFSIKEKSQLNFKRLNITVPDEKKEEKKSETLSSHTKLNESLNKSNLKLQ